MDPASIVEVTKRTQFCPQTDGQTDRQLDSTDDVKPVYPLSTLLKKQGFDNSNSCWFMLIYYGKCRAISFLLMPWLLASSGHFLERQWQHNFGQILAFLGGEFHFSVHITSTHKKGMTWVFLCPQYQTSIPRSSAVMILCKIGRSRNNTETHGLP